MIDTTKIVQALRVDGTLMTLAGSQDYQIVTAEPTDKSQGKMIYENVSSPIVPEYDPAVTEHVYGAPQNLVDKYLNDSENWTWDDVRNLEWLGMTEDASTNFWDYVLPIDESKYDALYSNANNPLKLKAKINGIEQELSASFDSISQESGATWGYFDERGLYGFTVQTLPNPLLYGGISSGEIPHIPCITYAGNYSNVEILSISSQDGTEIWKNVGKSSVFDITNLKIADGTKYNSLKDLISSAGSQDYVPTQSEAEPVALTWIINEKPSIITTGLIETPKFTIKGVTKDKLYGQSDNVFTILEYYYDQYLCAVVSRAELGKEFTIYNYSTEQWANQDYRTLMFETAPTGNLLEWLQANAVPQSEATTGSKTYAQVTNENGAVSIRVFENSDADLQNLSITKDGVTINGKKPLTSVQPLYKHELVIPYSFSVGDSETVNGSVTYHYLSNTGTQITSASEIDDNFMLSGGIGKNGSNTAASQSESTALTWQLNDTLTLFGEETKVFDINFTSNNQSYIGLKFQFDMAVGQYMIYMSNSNGITAYTEGGLHWVEGDAYKTITFETAPTGELLTWLQSNAVPQGGVDSNTVLLFNVNVTKAGSSITVEAVNASTMGYITGTVGTITDTVTQLI